VLSTHLARAVLWLLRCIAEDQVREGRNGAACAVLAAALASCGTFLQLGGGSLSACLGLAGSALEDAEVPRVLATCGNLLQGISRGRSMAGPCPEAPCPKAKACKTPGSSLPCGEICRMLCTLLPAPMPALLPRDPMRAKRSLAPVQAWSFSAPHQSEARPPARFKAGASPTPHHSEAHPPALISPSPFPILCQRCTIGCGSPLPSPCRCFRGPASQQTAPWRRAALT
jgi:hypothetical protein